MNTAALYKEDNFDLVHDSQQIFKSMMMATAFPGSIRKLRPIGLAGMSKPHAFALQPLLTLLDLETSYHVYSLDAQIKQSIETYLSTNTTSIPTGPETAGFILCLEPSAKSLFSSFNRGTLFCPDQGATLIYLVDEITPVLNLKKTSFSLTGPGIRDTVDISVDGLDIKEPLEWEKSREDYPMGIDIFIVSSTGDIIGIPRSVTIHLTNHHTGDQ